MARVGKISEVTGTDCEGVFEWVISEFQVLKDRLYYSSPSFRMSGSLWCIQIARNHDACKVSERSIRLILYREDIGAVKTLNYTLGIKRGSGLFDETVTRINCFCQNNRWGEHISIKWENIFTNDLKRHLSALTVICRIKCCAPHTVKERNFVSCAVQTEVPGSLSCATQTKISGILIEELKPRDWDFSSLKAKGIMLLSDRMKHLLKNSTDYDVKICVKDKEFRAHRNILSARSHVFAMMLTGNTVENNTGTIKIEDCDPESFDEFLLYVYSGRTENLTTSKALQLYYPADKYDFPVLKEWCVSFLKTSLCVTSICDVILLASKHEEKKLLEAATEFFARNIEEILGTFGWLFFMSQNPLEANELYIKSLEFLTPKTRNKRRTIKDIFPHGIPVKKSKVKF